MVVHAVQSREGQVVASMRFDSLTHQGSDRPSVPFQKPLQGAAVQLVDWSTLVSLGGRFPKPLVSGMLRGVGVVRTITISHRWQI